MFNGEAVKSCTLLAPMLDGGTLTTIEGLSGPGGSNALHPMQQAFHQNHGLQCGFCTPGMVMTAVALADEKSNARPKPRCVTGLEGNICRCTGYQNIVASVLAGAAAMHAPGGRIDHVERDRHRRSHRSARKTSAF